MCFLELSPEQVHLKGISRTTSFTIRNPNEFLAVSFQLVMKAPSKLSFFPEKGILLTSQSQKIKIKYTGSAFQSSVEEFNETISVRYTFKIEYNRTLMIKKKMKGWEQIPDEIQQKFIHVYVGGQKEAIQQYIKEDIIFNEQFKDSKLNLSAIKHSRNQSFINQNSFQNLAIDSKIQSQGVSQKDKRTCGTGLELPFQELCPLQYGESRANNVRKDRPSMMRYQMVESKMVEDVNKSFEVSMKTAQNNGFSMCQDLAQKSLQGDTKNKGGELVILAIIAAFFLALGNNLGRLIN